MILVADLDSVAYACGSLPSAAAAYRRAKEWVESIRQAVPHDQWYGFLEHPTMKCQFRRHLAVTRPYKGNRNREKPPYMAVVKEYLVAKHGCTWVHYMESEDAAAIVANEKGYSNSTIACIDKDLYQIPTNFYDYRTNQSFTIDQESADRHLYQQVLTGDSTDNIPGLDGVGPAKASAILGTDSNQWLHNTIAAYLNSGKSYEYLLEQSRLVYIIRKRNEVYTICSREQFASSGNDE